MRRPRRIKPKAFIICNGIETEYNYFSGLRSYLGREGNYIMNVKTIKGDPISVLEQLLEGKFALKHFDDEIDEAFVVFDIDDFYDQNGEALVSIINKAIKARINVIFSNPCFEYWLLIHLKETYSTLDAKKAIELLKKEYKKAFSTEYQKNLQEIYNKFLPYEDEAIGRCEGFTYSISDIENSIKVNPSTRIHTLVKLLKNTENGS